MIVGDNKFVTITDPADQSTMVYGDLPVNFIGTKINAASNGTVFIPLGVSNHTSSVPSYIYSSNHGITWDKANVMVAGTKFFVSDFGSTSKSYYPPSTRDTIYIRLLNTGAQINYAFTGTINSSNPSTPNWISLSQTLPATSTHINMQGQIHANPAKFNKYSPTKIGTTSGPGVVSLPNNTLTKSYAYNYDPSRNASLYAYIGSDGFLYESIDGTTYTKNTATVIPSGQYHDIEYAGGKWVAPIYGTNKLVVIG